MRRSAGILVLLIAAAALPAAARPLGTAVGAPMTIGSPMGWATPWNTPDVAPSWSQPGYNAAHTGFNPREKMLTARNVATLTQGFNVVTNAEINADLVESNGILYADSSDGNLYAMNAKTGALSWTFPGTQGDWPQGVALSGGKLFVTCQIDANHAGLCALNPRTGKVLWTWAIYDDPASNPVGSAPYTGPVVSGNTVVLGESDTASFAHVGYFVGLDVRTGNPIWVDGNCGNNGSNDCNGLGNKTPAIASGTVYYGTLVVGQSIQNYDVCAVKLASGATTWCSIVGDPNPAIAVAGNTVYVNAFVNAQHVMDAFNATTGAALWQHVFADGGNNDFRPAIQGKTVYIGGGNNLDALNAITGASKWEVVGGAVSSPSVANGVVYAGCQGLCAYAGATGRLLWNSPGSVTRSSGAAPAVVSGRLYGVCNYNNACSYHR